MVKITDTVCGRSHLVHKNRLRKAKLKLGRREIALDLAKGGGYGCSCQRRCGEGIPIGFAEDLRARLFAEPTEQAASNVIVGWLCGSLPRGNRARYIITDGLARYHCCAATYSGIVGVRDVLFLSCALNHHLFLQVSLKKLYKCARAATASQGRGATFIHGNSGRIGRVGGGPGNACSAFLRHWTENFCQIDGGGRVLWPQGRTIKEVFSTTFQDWLVEQNAPESVISTMKVSLSSFRNALADPEFAHVKMRKEHNHVRCDKYARLSFFVFLHLYMRVQVQELTGTSQCRL